MQWDKIVQELHCKDTWIGVNGESHKSLHMQSWTIFPADAAEKQHFYMQQTVKKPQQVTVHQYMYCMGVLNDYLACPLPMVYDSSKAVEGMKKSNVLFNEADLAKIILNSVPVT
jgi:hypothetical protein